MTGRSARSRTPEELVLHRTRTRLAMVTLALVAGLLAAVGVVTQLAATRLMDENVRRAMDGAMRSALGTDETHEDDGSSRTPAGSETFVLYLDEEGAVLGKSRKARTRYHRNSQTVSRPYIRPSPPNSNGPTPRPSAGGP